uniref:Secreted protein n=1 Tax=Strongyloides papillosus TaxID=174720 RepID=A0A0N5BAY4_STREA
MCNPAIIRSVLMCVLVKRKLQTGDEDYPPAVSTGRFMTEPNVNLLNYFTIKQNYIYINTVKTLSFYMINN